MAGGKGRRAEKRAYIFAQILKKKPAHVYFFQDHPRKNHVPLHESSKRNLIKENFRDKSAAHNKD